MIFRPDVILPRIPEKADEATKKFYNDTLQVLKDLRRDVSDSFVKQPDWTPVTYINSWVDYAAGLLSKYYKDILGCVHLRLGCKNGTTAYPFVMPEGYRPDSILYSSIYTIPSGTTVVPACNIYPDGVVLFVYYANIYVFSDEIIYRAE